MNQISNKTNFSEEQLKRIHLMFLGLGIIDPAIAVILDIFNASFANIFKSLVGLSVLVAIIFLFSKKYKIFAKKYLLGIIIAIVGSAILGFIFTFIVVALKK